LSSQLQHLSVHEVRAIIVEPRLSSPSPPLSFEEAAKYRLIRNNQYL
jgi:hypothetical protein